MVEIEAGLRENTVGALEQFATIASTDPISAAMLLVGAILTGFSLAVFGGLTLGAIGASIRRALSGPGAPTRLD